MNNTRKATNLILEAIDDGFFTREDVLTSLLLYPPERDVAEFYQYFLRISDSAEYLPALDQ
jgi:hypothetical protein